MFKFKFFCLALESVRKSSQTRFKLRCIFLHLNLNLLRRQINILNGFFCDLNVFPDAFEFTHHLSVFANVWTLIIRVTIPIPLNGFQTPRQFRFIAVEIKPICSMRLDFGKTRGFIIHKMSKMNGFLFFRCHSSSNDVCGWEIHLCWYVIVTSGIPFQFYRCII